MLEVFDRSRNLVGILQYAYGIQEDLKINAINYFTFSLPYNDTKNKLCNPFYHVRYNKGELYRILPSQLTLNELGDLTYKCEHVFALLIDHVLKNPSNFLNPIVIGNIGVYTSDVINYILSQQPIKNWILNECDFNRQFEYGFTHESLLSALMQVPNPFTDKYMWTFDTSVYPYKLNLKKIDENVNPQMYIRTRKNLLSLQSTSDPTSIVTRLYPLGEGEGINQLNITSVNNGVPYIQSPDSYIDKYGVIERVWVDRRYTNAESLYDAGKAMLSELQEPFEQYQVDFAILGEGYYDTPAIGKIVEIVDFKKTFITGITYNHDEVKKSKLTIANKPKDVVSSLADMMDRQRIEMTYSQGATQFYQDHVYDNADPFTSLLLKLMIPATMKIINFVKIDIEVGAFRKPFTVTGGGGAQTISQSSTSSSGASSSTTTSSGGGQTSGASSTSTTQSDGYSSSSTSSGGGQTSGSSSTSTSGFAGGGMTPATSYGVIWQYNPPNSQSGEMAIGTPIQGSIGSHIHNFNSYHSHRLDDHSHTMYHTHDVYSHQHYFSVSSHSHGMYHYHDIYAHTHDMYHNHSIEHTHSIPDHIHSLDAGISFEGNPTSFDLIVNGITRQIVIGDRLQLDITNFLVDEKGLIQRDKYHLIEVLPNDTAYIMLTVNVQGFIQSRGENTV